MSNRITQKDLEQLCLEINKTTNQPLKPVDKMQWQIGNYHLDYAYGGVKLVQVMNENGGIRTISTDGYDTKRKLYNWMEAFLYGLRIK